MHIVERALTIARGLLKRYGPSKLKKYLWDQEFVQGDWDRIDDTTGDYVYPHLERFARNGAILDIGCGPGNVANEVADTVYSTYVGVDISDAALEKARRRTVESGRLSKNRFEQGDFLAYKPNQQFDVILAREAMYHVPAGSVLSMLERYSRHLTDGGVFIVKMSVNRPGSTTTIHPRLKAMMEIIEINFEVVEDCRYGDKGQRVVVFRPKTAVKRDVSKRVSKPADS